MKWFLTNSWPERDIQIMLIESPWVVETFQSECKGLERYCDTQQQRTCLLRNASSELQSQCRSYEKECSDVRSDVEDIRLKESLIRLELRRRQHFFEMQHNTVLNLQNEKKTIENVSYFDQFATEPSRSFEIQLFKLLHVDNWTSSGGTEDRNGAFASGISFAEWT